VAGDNIATRKGSFAIEVSLLFQLPASTVCTSSFLDWLTDAIVNSITRTDKNLFRLYCEDSTVKVQILNTYFPVKNLRSNDDVALELQRQLSYAGSPLRSNVTSIDPTFRPPPIQVTNCSDTSVLFEPVCCCSGRSAPVQTTWLGLESHSYSTILIFAAAGALVCLLLAIAALCARRFWQDKLKVENKAKWIVAVQKEQAMELAVAKRQSPPKDKSSETSIQLLPRSLAIPSLPVLVSVNATPPAPCSVPTLQQEDSNNYDVYSEQDVSMHTPPSGDVCEEEEEIFDTFVLQEISDHENCLIANQAQTQEQP